MNRKSALSIAISALDSFGTTVTEAEAKATLESMLEVIKNKPVIPSKKEVQRKADNEVIKSNIVTALNAVARPLTIAELNAEMGTTYSPSKMSALLTIMERDGKVVVTHIGRTAYFDTLSVAKVSV